MSTDTASGKDGSAGSPDVARVLGATCELAVRFLECLPSRAVAATASVETMRGLLSSAMPARGEDALSVIEHLARALEPGLVASAGPRYFGFVMGGATPAALAADWLTAAWDQNAFSHVSSPAASVVEEIVAAWLLDLFGLPRSAGVGLVTGGQMANFTCLAAARGDALARLGVDVEQVGLAGAPEIAVLVGAQAHVTIDSALRFLGIGRRQIGVVAADEQGRMRPEALREALRRRRDPVIVCTQAGNVNTGAFDPLREIVAIAHAHNAWVHVDGAFGLWAAAHPELRRLTDGVETADSWAVDGHKWLNVPYDSGFAIVANARAHYHAMRLGHASYLVRSEGGQERAGSDWVPESSRRARAFAVYAGLRSLGRTGVTELVERCCIWARRLADSAKREPGVVLMNEVVLNQVLLRFVEPGVSDEGDDELTTAVIRRVQEGGVCWVGPTTHQGRAAMRVSISNWSTTGADVDRAAQAIVDALRACRPPNGSPRI